MSSSDPMTDFECPVCLQRFHDPIILDCGHTIDRSCIQKMIDSNKSSNRTLECPLCTRTFDPRTPLISNVSLANLVKTEATFEWFIIDISSRKQGIHALQFLDLVFSRRDLAETNHITVETGETRIAFTSSTNLLRQLQIKPLSNLDGMLQEACTYLQQQAGVRKICILTDGLIKHSNARPVDSNIINRRFIIHIGDKYVARTRQFADEINCQFGHFDEKTLDMYVQHFMTYF